MRKVLLTPLVLVLACAQNARGPSPLAKLESDFQAFRQVQADQNAELASLRADLGQLRGKIEELEHYQSESVSKDMGSLKEQLAHLKQRVPPPAVIPQKELEDDEAYIATLPADVAAFFDRGFSSLRTGEYGEALDNFNRVIELGNSKQWSATAMFWIAVCVDGQGQLKDALQAYNDFVSAYPKHGRAPLALYKQASVFIKLGDTKVAKLTLQKLIGQFPKSAWAAEAKRKIADL